MLMYEIWSLGKKPFSQLSPTEVTRLILSLHWIITSPCTCRYVFNVCLGTVQLGLHRATNHEDIECSCLASVLYVDPILVDRSLHRAK